MCGELWWHGELHHYGFLFDRAQGELDSRILSKPVTKCDAGIQTDVHAPLPEGTGIVKSYEWNEWEMRRKALQLVCVGVPLSHALILFVENAMFCVMTTDMLTVLSNAL